MENGSTLLELDALRKAKSSDFSLLLLISASSGSMAHPLQNRGDPTVS